MKRIDKDDDTNYIADSVDGNERIQGGAVTTKKKFPNGKRPSFAKDLSVIPGDFATFVAEQEKEKQEAPKASTTKLHLLPFPIKEAQKVVDMVRKGNREGSVTTTFSLRKLMMWGEAFYLLQREGFEHKEALAGAFHLAAEAKTFGEDATYLREAFEKVFGFDVKPPRVHGNTARADGNRHPVDYLVEPLIREGRPVWMYGPTGSGKSHSSKDIPRRLGRPWLRVQGSDDSTVDDLVGGPVVRDRNTYFEYGPLPLMMKAGGVLIVDEVTLYPQEILMELQAVLEGEPLVLKRNKGEVVFPKPGFTIVVTDNSLGLGEAIEYVGTQVMNEAFRDRFYFVRYDYMPESQERRAVNDYLTKFLAERNWTVQ